MDWIALAQSRKLPVELWITCGILIGLIVLLGTVVLLYRRKLLANSDTPCRTDAWNLDDLQRLKSQGEITEAEYQAMRATIIRGFTGEGKTDPEARLPEVPPGVLSSGSGSSPRASDEEEDWEWVAEGYEDETVRRKTDT